MLVYMKFKWFFIVDSVLIEYFMYIIFRNRFIFSFIINKKNYVIFFKNFNILNKKSINKYIYISFILSYLLININTF